MLPKDQPNSIHDDSDTANNNDYPILSNADRYPISVNNIRNKLRLLQFESKTLHEILNILKQRLDETRNVDNKEDLAELWTKYHMYVRDLEQKIEHHTAILATYEFEQKVAIHTTGINERLTRLNRMIDAVRIQLESQRDNISLTSKQQHDT